MLSSVSKFILKSMGWTLLDTKLPENKYVIIGAPHTSNWDFPLVILSLTALGLKFSWVAKESLFFPPLGYFFKAIGGIGVNRSRRNEFLKKIKSEFANRENFSLAIAPEGTRSYTDHWKLGFYQIALEANAKLAFGTVNYEKKEIGLAGSIELSGDIEKDFKIISTFYQNHGRGLYVEKESKIAVREKELKIYKRIQAKKKIS
ncbi:MAG: 1-acyl-sn-glycerol-3-phosphate acyltransferase [Desulfotalea sp.]